MSHCYIIIKQMRMNPELRNELMYHISFPHLYTLHCLLKHIHWKQRPAYADSVYRIGIFVIFQENRKEERGKPIDKYIHNFVSPVVHYLFLKIKENTIFTWVYGFKLNLYKSTMKLSTVLFLTQSITSTLINKKVKH